MNRHLRILVFFLTLACWGSPKADGLRARDLGIKIGILKPGPFNAITDVRGVKVGHVTLNRGEGKLVVGKGPVRTGVTAILPHGDDIYSNMVFAAAEVLNGNGEMTGMEWVNERGLLEVPIILTNTLSVGTAYDGVVAYMLKQDLTRVPLPVVAECYDGGLNDIAGRHVREEHVMQAIESAKGGLVPEGSVGAGTGMRAYQFKAGIGTASRIVHEDIGGYTVGVLVNANLGRRRNLRIDGVPVGEEIPIDTSPTRDGSIIIVVATDAPVIPTQIRRMCRRAAYGLARTGTASYTGSGDLVIGFSTAQIIPRDRSPTYTVQTVRDGNLSDLFRGVAEATEEAIVNALCAADTMVGRDGRIMPAIPQDRLVKILSDHGRMD